MVIALATILAFLAAPASYAPGSYESASYESASYESASYGSGSGGSGSYGPAENGGARVPKQRTLAQQRTANEKAYEENATYLREIHAGRWVVIAGGVVLASFDRWEAATSAADRVAPDAQHRFVFRPGIDDGDEEFVQSPWTNSDPSWIQLGRRFRRDHPLTISSCQWSRRGKVHATPDGRGWVSIGAPGETPRARTRTVCSNLFEQDISITGDIAEALRLERFSVPGTAWLGSVDRVPCRKVRCRVTLDDLGIDSVFTAFVIPSRLVDRWPPKVPAQIAPEKSPDHDRVK